MARSKGNHVAGEKGNRVAKEDRMKPVVIHKPKVEEPKVKPIPTKGLPFGRDHATNPKAIGVCSDQGFAKGKQAGVGQAAASKKPPMYTIDRGR